MSSPQSSAKIAVRKEGKLVTLYDPYDYQQAFHASDISNLLVWGPRDTGKSLMLRMDAILRCLIWPGFKALIVRRTYPQLLKSHLGHIGREMDLLGGRYVEGKFMAKFPNGSTITFGHCEADKDSMDYLSSEYGAIYFDELSTFTLSQFTEISAAARAPKTAPYHAVVRAGSNPLGIGARWMREWFIKREVDYGEYEDYDPADFGDMFVEMAQNKSADIQAYQKKLKNLPKHVRSAWLHGKFIDEGSYFGDFLPVMEDEEKAKEYGIQSKGQPWHVIRELPTIPVMVHGQVFQKPMLEIPWLNIYRSLDWGYAPDPAVCHWTAVLPSGHEIMFKERKWNNTLAADVAKEIRRESQGMRIVETFADPSIFAKRGETTYSVGEIIEQHGVILTQSINDRELYGYSIHDHLNTIIDGRPKLQILAKYGTLGCPELIRTIPEMQVDAKDAKKIAAGEDHYVVSCAYLCIGSPTPSKDPRVSSTPRWMQKKQPPRLPRYVRV